jgi:hypothetical protein
LGTSARGRGKQREGGQTWLIYFIYMYENKTLTPVEIVLRKGKEDKRERWKG